MFEVPCTDNTKEIAVFIDKYRKPDEKKFFIEMDLGLNQYTVYKNKCPLPKYNQMTIMYDLDDRDKSYVVWYILDEESHKHLLLMDKQFYENDIDLLWKRKFARSFDSGKLVDLYANIIDENVSIWMTLKEEIRDGQVGLLINVNDNKN